ncbi:aspartate/glutamate racemase family protein [Kutzneria albida]|uniref:Hydantoin racemase n=1 Tax=Kutzneria albida DSM 43870 TaxID=1449976 RepID=W5WGK2_9PSEU|nr:aspartate/glutamate racemase family protein [Kutzneria albida]AHH99880.1 hypothetical protein KALB_6521 [Kutzneria albida DSM 43870]
MRITVINPNTSQHMTDLIGQSARGVALPGTVIDAVCPDMGPASIESHYDEALSVPGLLARIESAERAGAEGHVIACFGDPGLDAARELATGPVVGIAEAAMRVATSLGRSFSVVTTLRRTCGRAWDLAERYGVRGFCAGVHACEVPVLDVDGCPELIAATCRSVLERDGSDVLVLGCAGMTSLCAKLSAELGVPVVDGVRSATLLVQSLVLMGLRTGKHGEFAAPPPKPYAGPLHGFGRG